MDDEEVNTTKRYNHYCKARAKDGRKCQLYLHDGYHVENHGKSTWEDGE